MTVRFERLAPNQPIVTPERSASMEFAVTWQRLVEQMETAIVDLSDTVAAIAAAQAAADAANAAAENATATTELQNSWADGATLSASDAGSDATISVTGHDRIYSGGTTVAVNAGSVTGLPYSTLHYVYYDDPTRAGGAVTYQATTSESTAAQTGNRHTVGSITTPAALAGPTGGFVTRPPGVGTINQ